MANRIVIATPKLSDAGTITAGSEAAAMPASNLLRQQPGDRWRAEDLSSAWLQLDLGSATAINLIWLGYTNASSAATWRIRAASTEAGLTGGSPGYDSGALDHWPTTGLDDWLSTYPGFTHAYKWLGTSAQTFRYWRIDISDSANADGYYQAGRLYLANAWQPTRNIAYGWNVGWADPSDTVRAASGAGFSNRLRRYRELRFSLPFLSEDEMYSNAAAIDRLRGASGDMLVIPKPETPARFMDQAIYGLSRDLRPIVQARTSIFQKPYLIEELLP